MTFVFSEGGADTYGRLKYTSLRFFFKLLLDRPPYGRGCDSVASAELIKNNLLSQPLLKELVKVFYPSLASAPRIFKPSLNMWTIDHLF